MRYAELGQNGNLAEQHTAQSRSAVPYTNSKSSAEQSRGQGVDVRWLAKMERSALTIFWHWTKYRKKKQLMSDRVISFDTEYTEVCPT